MNYLISSAKWQWIQQSLQEQKGLHTGNIGKLRTFIEAVVYILKAGCQWRMLPPIYGHWRAVHKRFKAWADRGVWENLFVSSQSEPDTELAILDATIVKAHACSTGYQKKV